jgi:hypothetical protein
VASRPDAEGRCAPAARACNGALPDEARLAASAAQRGQQTLRGGRAFDEHALCRKVRLHAADACTAEPRNGRSQAVTSATVRRRAGSPSTPCKLLLTAVTQLWHAMSTMKCTARSALGSAVCSVRRRQAGRRVMRTLVRGICTNAVRAPLLPRNVPRDTAVRTRPLHVRAAEPAAGCCPHSQHAQAPHQPHQRAPRIVPRCSPSPAASPSPTPAHWRTACLQAATPRR